MNSDENNFIWKLQLSTISTTLWFIFFFIWSHIGAQIIDKTFKSKNLILGLKIVSIIWAPKCLRMKKLTTKL